MSRYNRRAIFLAAWQEVRRDAVPMSIALTNQWALARVRTALATGVAEFAYMKLDGTRRYAHGTRNALLIPIEKRSQASRPCREGLIRYYDTDKRGWRSFYTNRLVSIN